MKVSSFKTGFKMSQVGSVSTVLLYNNVIQYKYVVSYWQPT